MNGPLSCWRSSCSAALATIAVTLFPATQVLSQPYSAPIRQAPNARSSSAEPPMAGANPQTAPVAPTPQTDIADPPVPIVAVRVRVPATATAGQELNYRVVVDNASDAPAHHVLVRVPLPANSRYSRSTPEPSATEPELQWSLGTMQGRARREIALVLEATGEGDIRCCARVQFEHGQCVRTRLTKSELRLQKEGPKQALLYDPLKYRLEVTNTGSAPATDVVVTDTLPDGLDFSDSTPSTKGDNPLTWKLGTIPAGQSRKIEYSVFAKKGGTLTNKAVVTAAGGQRQEASSTVVIGEAKLSASKAGPKRRLLTRPATYQITVSNTGNMTATGVQIVDEVPTDIAFVSASDGGQHDGTRVRWSLGSLAPGAKRTVQVVLRAKKAGELINRATVTDDRKQTVVAEARTVFETATGLTLEIDKGEDPVEVGRTVTYTIHVLNQGNAAATALGITVIANDQLKITGAKGPTAHQQDGNRLSFAPLAGLAGGTETTFTITVQAVRAGDARLRVEMIADQLTPGSPLKQEENTTVFGEASSP